MTTGAAYGKKTATRHPVFSPSGFSNGIPAMTRIAHCWYSETADDLPQHPILDEDVTADVCVLGGGITGCTAALQLAQRGLSVRLLEARRVATGGSGRAGGHLVHGYSHPLTAEATGLDPRMLQALWDLSADGVQAVRDLIATHGIDCGLTDGHIRLATKTRHVPELEALAKTWQTLGHPGAAWLDRGDLEKVVKSRRYIAGLRDPLGGHLHPMNYTLGLARAALEAGVTVNENTPVLRHEKKGNDVVVRTPLGSVTAKWLVIAGNATLWDRKQAPGDVTLPVYSFVAATEPLGEKRARSLIPGNEALMDMAVVPNHIRRTPDHRMMVGGIASHLNVDPFNMQYALRDVLDTAFSGFAKVRMTHAWGGPVSITRSRLPHFGRKGKSVLFAQGFNGMGLALATQAGRLMAEVIAGTEERFDLLSSVPHKTYPGGGSLRTPLLLMALTRLKAGDWKRDWDDNKARKAERKAAQTAAKG